MKGHDVKAGRKNFIRIRWGTTLIVFMGPIVNLIFAYICFVFVYVAGFPALAPTVGKVMAGFPAMIADLREGDKIIRIDGKTITNWEDMQRHDELRRANAPGSLVRCQEELRKDLTPKEQSHKNISGEDQKVWLLRVSAQRGYGFLAIQVWRVFCQSRAAGLRFSIVSTTFQGLVARGLWRHGGQRCLRPADSDF